MAAVGLPQEDEELVKYTLTGLDDDCLSLVSIVFARRSRSQSANYLVNF